MSKTKKKPTKATKAAKPKKPIPVPRPVTLPDAGPALVPAQTMPPESGYEWVRALVSADEDGRSLHWEFRESGATADGCRDHKGDLSEWSEEDIRNLTCNMLDLDERYADLIEIVRAAGSVRTTAMVSGGSSRGLYPLIQGGEGGSIPTPPLSAKGLRVEWTDFETARTLNRRWHSRLPRLGTGSVKNPGRRFTCFAATHDGLIYAVGIWSLPAARGLPQDGTWLELRRLADAPDAPHNTASRILRVMALLIRRTMPLVSVLCSMQDTEAHTGSIYRAAGWVQAGEPRKGKAEWDCASRPRPKAQSDAPKQRWEKEIRAA